MTVVCLSCASHLPIGTTVKLQVDAGDNAPWYVINTADFYNVAAPIAQPANSINVTQAPYNVDNTGVTTPPQNAIFAVAAESSGQTIYIPAGTYTISQQLFVNNVTIIGAGEWYTTMTGTNVEFAGFNPATGNTVSITPARRDLGPVRPTVVHREQRAERRPALGIPDLRITREPARGRSDLRK